jgi:hypothetical protein
MSELMLPVRAPERYAENLLATLKHNRDVNTIPSELTRYGTEQKRLGARSG